MYPDEPVILLAAAKGLANRNCNVILLAGEGRNLERLNPGSLAPNVRLEQGIPLSDLLPIADAVVTNGDSETAMAALHHRLPMVLAPAILDQPEISWRVSAAGAGLRVRLRDCSPERLATAVETVLTEKRFRDNAARLAESFTEYSGGDKAAVLLENLAFTAGLTAPRGELNGKSSIY
jgi:UDP:flavonoid glycosyltransferase YjiC (YdhE family)